MAEAAIMQPVNGNAHEDALAVVVRTLTTVSPNLSAAGAETPLMGSQAVLDSVGFVTFLVSLEQNLDNTVDLVSAFTAQGEVTEPDHPFGTVGSLVAYIDRQRAART